MFLSLETRVKLDDSKLTIATRVASEVTRVTLDYSNFSTVTRVA